MIKKGKTIFIVIVLFIVVFLISCPIVNNITASHLINDIEDIPLPQKTHIVEKISQAGKLNGNGNGMQYFGAVLLESELSLEDIDQYYASYRQTSWDYIVEVQETQDIHAIEHGHSSFQNDVSKGHFYIVYSWGKGISPFQYFDLRGH